MLSVIIKSRYENDLSNFPTFKCLVILKEIIVQTCAFFPSQSFLMSFYNNKLLELNQNTLGIKQ